MFQLYGPERGHRTSRELSVWLCERSRDNALCSEKEANMTTRHDTNWLFIELNRGFVVEVLSDDDWMTLCGVPESLPSLKPFARSKRSTTSIIIFFLSYYRSKRTSLTIKLKLAKIWKKCKARERDGARGERIANSIGTWVSNNISYSLGSCIFHFFFARVHKVYYPPWECGVMGILSCTSRCFEIALISLMISHVSERQWDASIYWTHSTHALFERSLDRFYYRIFRVARRYSIAVPTVQLGSECRRVNGWWHSTSNWVAIGIIYLLIVERIYRENSFCKYPKNQTKQTQKSHHQGKRP